MLGTSFFQGSLQNIDIQDFTLDSKYQSEDRTTPTSTTIVLSKGYRFFLSIVQKQ